MSYEVNGFLINTWPEAVRESVSSALGDDWCGEERGDLIWWLLDENEAPWQIIVAGGYTDDGDRITETATREEVVAALDSIISEQAHA